MWKQMLTGLLVVLWCSTQVLSQCDVHCVGMTCITGPGTCDSACAAGYGLNITTFRCEPCSKTCSPASSCNVCGPGKCDTSCRLAGYSVYNCNCVRCSYNCTDCSHSGAFKCDPGKCQPGYALDYLDTCQACSSRCTTTCSSPGTCDVGGCNIGYGSLQLPSGLYICSPCDKNCAGTCSSAGAFKCDSACVAGYSLNSTTGRCYRCGPHCTGKCASGPGFCDDTCEKGFYLSAAIKDPTKKACYPCATHCQSGCSAKGCCDAAPAGSPANNTCDIGTYGLGPRSCNVCL